jgi:hypothetical protein
MHVNGITHANVIKLIKRVDKVILATRMIRFSYPICHI